MADTDPPRGPRVTRRDLLVLAGGAVLGAAVVGGGVGITGALTAPKSELSDDAGDESEESAPKLRRYVSTSLTVPAVTSWTRDGETPGDGYLFLSPRTDIQNAAILENSGEPVWIEPDGLDATDLRVQQYGGKPVLTYWSGTIRAGHGIGAATIKDGTYRTIATVRAGNGVIADLHEFRLTPRGTALLIAYPTVKTDLRPVGGPRDGHIFGGRVQEIDVASGSVLFDWDVLDHIDLDESYQELSDSADGSSPASAFDPFHLNSVAEDGDALLVSARHTHAVYAIDKATGEVRWRLGGRASDFDVAEDAQFSWQHDAQRQSDGRISLFDNHGKSGSDGVSAGLLLDLDESTRRATLHRKFTFDDHFGYAMGNMQVLPTGNVIVGWGTQPAVTEFAADGRAIHELRDVGDGSYRAYRGDWNGRPLTPPDVGVRDAGNGRMTVYASWNGATEVATWRVLTGDSPTTLTEAATAARSGFETSLDAPASRFVQVHALDGGGAVLAASPIRRRSSDI